jgi:myo-inositol-1(or 4)-monophosphatase
MTADVDLLTEYAAFAGRLADAARAETMPRFRAGQEVSNKAGIWFDPVTEADREAERAIRRMVNAVYPRHGVIGEEFGAERENADLRWIIDPVDGTRAYVCGVATWATLIALEKNAKPALGLIDQPFSDERWLGRDGRTTYRRRGIESECRTSGVTELKRARLSTTDPRREAYFTGDEAEVFAAIAAKSQVARFSLDAYAYGLLALGELDLVVEASLKLHDYAALIPIVEGAGGVITGWKGEPLGDDKRGRVIAAATPALHRAALEILRGV